MARIRKKAITAPKAATPDEMPIAVERLETNASRAASATGCAWSAGSAAIVASRPPLPSCSLIESIWPAERSTFASDDSSELCPWPWKIAPSTATPKVPPTIRDIESNPEASPAFALSTAFIAAVDMGDIVSAIPKPIRMNGISSES